jgi:hypothetical protein
MREHCVNINTRQVKVTANINLKTNKPLYWSFEVIGKDNQPLKNVPGHDRAGFLDNSRRQPAGTPGHRRADATPLAKTWPDPVLVPSWRGGSIVTGAVREERKGSRKKDRCAEKRAVLGDGPEA